VSGASEAEQASCGSVAAALGVKSPTNVAEGSESGGFWSALGGKAKYATEPRLEVRQCGLCPRIL